MIMGMDGKLFEAAESGNVDFLKGTISTQPELLEVQATPRNNTAIHIAVQSHQLDFCTKILDLCPKLLSQCNLKDESPLHVAARASDLEIAKLLVSRANGVDEENKAAYLRMVTKDGDTALHVAVKNRSLSVTELLVEEDVGLLDLVNNEKSTPLSLAVDCGFPTIARFLLERTSPSDLLGDKNKTVLHSAVIHHHYDIIETLVNKNPDLIREFDGIGWTPLHYATLHGCLAATKILLRTDSSAAHLAAAKDGTSPFHIAAHAGFVKIMEQMLCVCPDIYESVDLKGRTALHHAVLGLHEQQDLFVLVLQLPRMLNIINEKDENGNTALHLAVLNKYYFIASVIAALKGTERTALNKDSLTPSDTFYLQFQQPSMRATMIGYWLEGAGRLVGRQKWVNEYWQRRVEEKDMGDREQKSNALQDKKEQKDVGDREQEINALREKKEEEGAMFMFQTQQLVAILIATVTFQATFTMPGGYSDDHHTANFIGKLGFAAYVFFNTTAFYLSIAVVVIQWATSPIGQRGPLRYALLVQVLLYLDILALSLAFSFAMVLVLSPSIFLAVLAFLCLGVMVLAHNVVAFVDPVANRTGNPRIERARESARRFLFRHLMASFKLDTVTAPNSTYVIIKSPTS